MRTRATADLGSLADEQFFERIAEGMDRCIRNAVGFFRDARRLGRGDRFRSSNLLLAFGHEEVAKYLILLDAVRCSRKDQKARARQLKRFNEHLAKGLYVELYQGRPATFGEVREKADRERARFFLDGPNDVDWIFRNTVLSRREELIYVDFVVRDEGSGWESPDPRSAGICGIDGYRSQAHQVALSLHAAGFDHSKALEVVARVWRGLTFLDDTHWTSAAAANQATVEALDDCGLLRSRSESVIRTILDQWLFPLHALDLSERDVALSELRQRQDEWEPDR